MKTSSLTRAFTASGYIALSLIGLSTNQSLAQGPAENAAQPAVSLPPGVDNLVKLSKAGMSEEIILTQVKGIGPVQLTTDQILYLNNAGVSQNVIKALLQNGQAAESMPPPPPAAETAAAPSPPPQGAPSSGSAPLALAVPANVRWVDTGVDLAPGQRVSISANGGISATVRILIPHRGTRVEYVQGLGPDGNPEFPTDDLVRPFAAPGLTGYSLVGRVAQTAPFEIGSNATFYSPSGGRLFLSVNANSFERNAGFWNVTLTMGGGQSAPAPAMEAAPTAPVSFDYFHDQLAPYGNWVQLPGYGWAWSPTVAATNPSWRPYADQGQWAYTDAGLYWQSSYPWGDIAFHYGRWTHAGGYGWVWVPAYDWAPSWVAWRHAESEGYVGWAPLPPSAEFVAGVGLRFHGEVAMDIDFGLPADAFVFIGYDHFWDRDYRGFFLPRDRVGFFYAHSAVRNGYRFEGGRFMVEGLGRDRFGALTHREVRAVDSRDLRAREERAHIETRRTDPAARRDVRTDGRQDGRPVDNRGQDGRGLPPQ